jgi:hypothetical protein
VENKVTIQKIENTIDETAVADAASEKDRKPERATKPVKSSKSGARTKQDQLVALLSKPNGARISTIIQKLGWQAHTVRAVISGLRKQDHEVVTSKSPKTGELVYTINAKPENDKAVSGASK